MSETAVQPMEADRETGRIGRIPVRNLWLLMLYASELFRDIEKADVRVEESPDDLPDLIAEILCSKVGKRIQRNLSHGYVVRDAVLGRVRGRIAVLDTERHRLLDRGQVACHFDELTNDTARNRFVRAALEEIAGVVRRDVLAHQCRSLARRLGRMGVAAESPCRGDPSIDRFGRHDTDDRPMVAAAHLAFDLALPTEAQGMVHLSLPDREVSWIRRLYERGVGGFYGVVLADKGWRVSLGKAIGWQTTNESPGIDRILPSMRTDIVLEHLRTGRRVVIDTKFNSVVTRGWHREETLRSSYVYQMYAYLRSQEGRGDLLAENAVGLLLHPSVGDTVEESVTIQGHEIRFATVDLGATTAEIRSRLLQVVDATRTG